MLKKHRIIISFTAFLFIAALASAEGQVQGLNDFKYWENGRIRQCDVYDKDGHFRARAFCRLDGTVEKVEKYDMDGNKVEEAFYDDKGRLRAGIDGWSAMRWWYQEGVLRSQMSYDENAQPMERKIYSEGGKLLARQYRRDISFEPYEEAAMAMFIGGQSFAFDMPPVREESPNIRR